MFTKCSVICYVISYFYSIGCRIENWVTADGCVHIAESVGSCRELFANSRTHRRCRRDTTRQFRRVGVGGVYWALVSYFVRSLVVGWFVNIHPAIGPKEAKSTYLGHCYSSRCDDWGLVQAALYGHFLPARRYA